MQLGHLVAEVSQLDYFLADLLQFALRLAQFLPVQLVLRGVPQGGKHQYLLALVVEQLFDLGGQLRCGH